MAWVLAMLLSASSALAQQGKALNLYFMISSGAQRDAWTSLVQAFEQQHPDIRVETRVFEQEQYKREFEQRLRREPVDVAFWFAGERLRSMVDAGVLAPLDTQFVAQTAKDAFTRASIDSTRVDTRHYALPFSYYAWGLFYSKSLFAQWGLKPPTTWTEFLALNNTLQSHGVTPLAVGAKAGWPAAAWFDYLNMRFNGLEFHQRLLRGQESFGDKRVTQVLQAWRQLLVSKYFLPDTMGQDWDSVLPYLYRQQVGMALLGGSAIAKLPNTGIGGRIPSEDIGFFPFPLLTPKSPRYEDAPLDVLVLPASGTNRAEAHAFLRFLATTEHLNLYNQAARKLSPRNDFATDWHPINNASKQLLDRADGIAFFFDRNAHAALVPVALDAFQQFMRPPHDVAALQKALQSVALPE